MRGCCWACVSLLLVETSAVLGRVYKPVDHHSIVRPLIQSIDPLDEMIEGSKQSYVSFQELALIYTALGEKEKAFDALDKALKERD